MIPKKTSQYQRQQLHALRSVRKHLGRMPPRQEAALGARLEKYLAFRRDVDRFLEAYFFELCNENCFRSRASACCSKEGIIAFFADVVVNAVVARRTVGSALDSLDQALSQPNLGYKCVFLGTNGCLWTVRPLVCAMFLCERAKAGVLDADPDLQRQWQGLRQREKRFRWPDRPVLFDELEAIFLRRAVVSELMYFHNSPGLLRVKRRAGLADSARVHSNSKSKSKSGPI